MYQRLCSLEEQVGVVMETTNRQNFCPVRKLLQG